MTHKHEWLKTLLRDSPKAEFSNQYFEALFEQIQLDAMQEGMRRAAQVVSDLSQRLDGRMFELSPKNSIREAANNLTLKDL